jgi:hypothetical protein
MFARIEDDGSLNLRTGEVFRKVEDAGSAITGR